MIIMPYGIESRATSRGTQIKLETIPGPLTTGINAHWGERILDADLVDRIKSVYPNEKMQEFTGFDEIWHQKDGTTRPQGIEDELEVGTLVLQRAIEANGWRPQDIAGLFVGSGVPIADDARYTDYAQTLAGRVGLNPDVYTHNTYAACASGGRELLNALSHPDMKGKPVIVMGMEGGITYLTENFDPENADALSMRFFSKGAAAKGVVPDETMTLLTQRHSVVRDERGLLAAHMTYEKLIDLNGDTWQTHGNTDMILMPQPKDGKRITMEGPRTGLYFIKNALDLVGDLYPSHLKDYPNLVPNFSAQHHPSLTVFENFKKRAENEGISVVSPWVVNDGNSSAATALIAHNRISGNESLARYGSVELFVAYGAGGSFDGGVLLHAGRPKKL